MSPLHYGLTPKMKPLSPRRSALVVALDIGTSTVSYTHLTLPTILRV